MNSRMKKFFKWVLATTIFFYLGICILFYFSQEKVLFDTSVKVTKDHVFKFPSNFEEKYIPMPDGKKLHGVLFKAQESKGLIFYLPGGRGMLDSIGVNAPIYTDLNYDFFVLNYRGFGKSEGKIESEKQFDEDMQTAYDYFKKEYHEDSIVVFGYSLGTGPAAALAAANNPKMLVLQAPYYSMNELSEKAFPYLPVSLLQRYKFPTNEYLKKVESPIVLIHGQADKRIPVDVSYRLKESLKPTDQLIVFKGQGHNNFEKNKEYLLELSRILE
ncbi:hypothetical protein CLV62_101365 [Dysgonomonas alginatilytica]|uniref:Serine aminopeptidase S33 domain-containing protein n=2 Tax=Dysgonomonas alginatilytica TaxID=1605892 RepID=A0A2V3PW05_9BACT|nr:hypothetical protein CLV62_101365 [Dysgonomonas alginatilytica]